MSSKKVNVKWGKEKFDVDLDLQQPPEVFVAQLYALSSVPATRQKIMFKGRQIKCDNPEWPADFVKQLTDGAMLMLMGTADPIPVAPKETTKFVEDLTESQIASALKIPPGLKNLGNTCYMNATLQCLRTIKELREALASYNGRSMLDVGDPMGEAVVNPNVSEAVTASAHNLFLEMDAPEHSNRLLNALLASQGGSLDANTVVPISFLHVLHQHFPQFAQRSEHGGGFQQQDANEFWVELMRCLQQQLKVPSAPGSTSASQSLIDTYFAIRISSKLKCEDPGDQTISESNEILYQISCFIDAEVKYLQSGIKQGLVEKISKNSTVLQREAIFSKNSRVSRLPTHLVVQVVRFFYKQAQHTNAKVLKDVKFPLVLDMFEFCDEPLKKKLIPERCLLNSVDDWLKSRLIGKKKGGTAIDTTEFLSTSATSPSEKNTKPVSHPISFEDDVGSCNSGMYELEAVLTHHGRTSKSGHYVAWVRQHPNASKPVEEQALASGPWIAPAETDPWLKMDDEDVSPVTAGDVLKLSGGGDHHCAYVLVYSARRRWTPPGLSEKELLDGAALSTASAAAATSSTPAPNDSASSSSAK